MYIHVHAYRYMYIYSPVCIDIYMYNTLLVGAHYQWEHTISGSTHLLHVSMVCVDVLPGPGYTAHHSHRGEEEHTHACTMYTSIYSACGTILSVHVHVHMSLPVKQSVGLVELAIL